MTDTCPFKGLGLVFQLILIFDVLYRTPPPPLPLISNIVYFFKMDSHVTSTVVPALDL